MDIGELILLASRLDGSILYEFHGSPIEMLNILEFAINTSKQFVEKEHLREIINEILDDDEDAALIERNIIYGNRGDYDA